MADVQHADAREGQSVQMAVSNAMVRLYKEQFGRGPTKARTNFAGPDTIVCTLEDSMTPAERNMVALGDHQRLRDGRVSSARFSHHGAAGGPNLRGSMGSVPPAIPIVSAPSIVLPALCCWSLSDALGHRRPG